MNELSQFYGPNSGYVLELYEQYQDDPDSVDAATRAFFENWSPPTESTPAYTNGTATLAPSAPAATSTLANAGPTIGDLSKAVAVANLAQSIREYGHLDAQLDPLGGKPPGDPSLALEYHGLTEDDLRRLPCDLIGGPVVERSQTSWDAINELRRIYSNTTGHDYDHLRIPAVREWLRYAAEADPFGPENETINEEALLKRLTQVETFEHFLQSKFPGKTRFSIEGLDMMVPILDEIVRKCAETGIHQILLGMAHRGRLNVLAHIIEKPYGQILAEFKDPVSNASLAQLSQLGWTGDVKYHKGADRALQSADLTIRMAPNPSHLEHVNPIVEGMARAAGSFVDKAGAPRQDQYLSMPLQIHGDASFSGQGIVAETLNFTRLAGYSTGGTIHIIANNQLGFTAQPGESRSTLYASDLAKGYKLPIVHVNANDPIACIRAARMAIAYRNHFNRDFVIDLIGYRRYGHNEGDEPRFTQPKMYAVIDDLPTVREKWAQQLVDEGTVEADAPNELVQQQTQELQEIFDNLELDETPAPRIEPPPPGAARKVDTAVSLETLQELHDELMRVPDGFNIHSRLERIRRRSVDVLAEADERTVDWATAERLALGSILSEKIAIRMTGEDVKRGTFSHRHAVLFDAESGEPYVPLHNIPQAKASFEIHNSPLTENATIGFEYGYNIERPERLVIWEAQYGDFINGAQPILDEFVVSGFAKWDQTPSLVLLLPHGYEGQGPDHSSGRLERFLQLAAEINMRIAYPTTAAQYFHLLRRQALLLVTDPLPLVVMTPKSLLRHSLSASAPRELAKARWHPVIDDAERANNREAVRRVLLCSGKVYVDLVSSDLREQHPETAIVRVEQLYPFPAYDLQPIFESYPNLEELRWVQEEPRNMGAWSAAKPQLETITEGKYPIRYVGRARRASPSEGSTAWHQIKQGEIVAEAFGD